MSTTLDRPVPRTLTWRDRLQPIAYAGGGWGVTFLVTLIAGLLRFIRLDQPATALDDGKVRIGYIFDEQYYACDAKSLITYGVEHTSSPGGAFCTTTGDPSFVVHPPLGKWLIGLGEHVFGFGTFGWRFAAAVFGTLTVLLVVRIGRRMTGSTVLGGLAGLLLALDGLHFVQSRVAMLDIFLCFFLVAAFGALVVDRDQVRTRLAAAPDPLVAPRGMRSWRLVAGLCMGAALATKWSALFPIAVLVALAVIWEISARRTAGIPEPYPWRPVAGLGLALLLVVGGPFPHGLDVVLAVTVLLAALGWEASQRRRASGQGVPSLLRLAVPAVIAFGLVPLAVYVVSWTGWFATDTGWSRHWAEGRGSTLPLVPDALRSWWHYHWEMYHFHSTLVAKHPYQSHPLTWPFLGRPVSYYYPAGIGSGRYGCSAASCSREVLAIGTPALWWAMIPACLGLAARWVSRRDWRASALLAMTAISILAWVPSDLDHRTMFLFYALPSVPFLCLGIALLAGWLIGPPGARRRPIASAGVGVYTSLVLVNFIYLYPVLAALTIPYPEWYHRMWFRSWI
ncbi:MAG TPA: phospholipid carrier-dependent glycosyltransferase [Mycobacteriales bacterium]|nr:phospholipid carrier-dependent glycosyltransferase [Mycobacteriales bacterium]